MLSDCDALIHADENERELIFDLRRNPKQTRVESGPKGQFELDYDILIRELNYNLSDIK
ncbi:hypothetical protein D3C86_1626510 [compost metagenome]